MRKPFTDLMFETMNNVNSQGRPALNLLGESTYVSYDGARSPIGWLLGDEYEEDMDSTPPDGLRGLIWYRIFINTGVSVNVHRERKRAIKALEKAHDDAINKKDFTLEFTTRALQAITKLRNGEFK